MKAPHIDIVVGGQFGSEGKGHICAQLAKQYPHATFVRVGGSNAGHTVVDAEGRHWPFRHLPVNAVLNSAPMYLAPGSEIDLEVLASEIEETEKAGYRTSSRLIVSPHATVVADLHKEQEASMQLTARVGSTAKGIGAARADRLMRNARTMRDELYTSAEYSIGNVEWGNIPHAVIEGTQGFGLGLHAGFYPQCTSGDCRNIDFLAQSGAPLTAPTTTWVVLRAHPIRVAGNSGPLKYETSWEHLNQVSGGYIEPERTTVTKKVRRVGRFDPELARRALLANGWDGTDRVRAVLTFADYLAPEIAGDTRLSRPMHGILAELEEQIGLPGFQFSAATTGPDSIAWL